LITTQKKSEDDKLACHHLLEVQQKKTLVKKPRKKMYLHSNKYDQSCALATIALANTIVPANMFLLANTIIPRSLSNDCSNNDCFSKHIETQFKC